MTSAIDLAKRHPFTRGELFFAVRNHKVLSYDFSHVFDVLNEITISGDCFDEQVLSHYKPLNICYHQCTPEQIKRAKWAIISFRKVKEEWNIPTTLFVYIYP